MTNEEYVYKWLRSHGYTHIGTCAIMGSMQSESGFVPYRLEGDMEKPLYPKSLEYTRNVDDEVYSFYKFYSDAKGYGLTQTTFHTRKKKLWRLAKDKGVSIGDIDLQLEFLEKEMTEDFPGIKMMCKGNGTLEACSSAMVRQFENPADHAGRLVIDLKQSKAFAVKYADYPDCEYDSCDDSQLREDYNDDVGADFSIFPVMNEKTYNPNDSKQVTYLLAMKSLLYKNGYAINHLDPQWADATTVLKSFQADSDVLDVDGICGKHTWADLYRRDLI